MTINSQSLALLAAFTLTAVLPAGLARAVAADNPQDKERQLIAVLQSDAPPQEKAITCKKLAVYGGAAAVPALAPLLTDKDLCSWARIALEAIPGPEAGEALRAALDKVQGRLLVGVINSIGYRRDAQALGRLTQKLSDADVDVAAAAAAALGRIGSAPAAAALVPMLASAPAVARAGAAEGCILCAERFLAEGRAGEAVRIYDAVRQAEVPKQKRVEAMRGAILARGPAGLPLLLEQLRSTDLGFFGIGLRTARELPGRDVTEAVAAEVDRAAVERQTQLVLVLADRGDAAVFPTIRKAAQTGSKPMRLACISALERMATVSCVPVLLDLATDDDRELAQPAMAALIRLPGNAVNADLVARLDPSSGKLRRVLVELAGQRRLAEALPTVVRCTTDADPAIRGAAFTTLGIIGEEKQAADLAGQLEKAQTSRERGDIERALLAISRRCGTACLPALLPLAQSGDSEVRATALHLLSGVGGPTALATVKAAINDKDEAVQDEAVRTLSTWPGNWPEDSAVAEPLLALAKSGKKPAHKVLGLRGYFEYLQGDKKLRDEEKASSVKELLPLANRSEEKRLAINALVAAPCGGSLEILAAMTAEPEISEEACLAVLSVAGKSTVPGASKELVRKSLQTVIEKSKTDRTKRRAEEALKRVG
jgi:HEAT repeat protein